MSIKTIQKRQQKDREAVLENLKRMPIVEVACTKSGISRATFYRWKNQDKEFSKFAEAAQAEGENLIGDLAISKIVKAINEDNLSAAMYWLNHRDPRFGNKVEITTNNQPQETLTPEQEDAVKKAMVLTGLTEKQPDGKD
jgi:Mg/Co/Ni transporter MgtE